LKFHDIAVYTFKKKYVKMLTMRISVLKKKQLFISMR